MPRVVQEARSCLGGVEHHLSKEEQRGAGEGGKGGEGEVAGIQSRVDLFYLISTNIYGELWQGTLLNAGDCRMASVYPSLNVLPLWRGREDVCGNQ